MLLSKVNEVIEKAKEYLNRYSLSELEAVKLAIKDIEKDIDRELKA